MHSTTYSKKGMLGFQWITTDKQGAEILGLLWYSDRNKGKGNMGNIEEYWIIKLLMWKSPST